MKALLDTHVWVWYLLKDDHLPEPHRAIIDDQSNDLWLSPISLWETHRLIERGRLKTVGTPASWINLALDLLPVREAPLTFQVATRARTLQLQHQDPADRFIAATAIEMKLPLLTADQRLRECPELRCP